MLWCPRNVCVRVSLVTQLRFQEVSGQSSQMGGGQQQSKNKGSDSADNGNVLDGLSLSTDKKKQDAIELSRWRKLNKHLIAFSFIMHSRHLPEKKQGHQKKSTHL